MNTDIMFDGILLLVLSSILLATGIRSKDKSLVTFSNVFGTVFATIGVISYLVGRFIV